MSSWLSGGLSQFSSLTDQISTFTKDVLSETTEEIEDPTAELQVARRKLEQLDEVNTHYKTEWEKLQRHSEEVRERAETAECQITTISQEYKKLIQERDTELRRLRRETESLREQQRKMVSGESSQSPLKEIAGERGFFPGSVRVGGGGGGEEGEWEVAKLEPVVMGGGGEVEGEGGWEEFHDFGDVISSQGEINRLQIELTKLRAESRHWRTLAKEKGHSTDPLTSGPMETELATLREQIEELQLCLQRERAQHQHQLSELEATCRENDHHTTHSPEPPVSDPVRDRGGGQVAEEEGVSVKMSEAMGYGVGGSATRESDETANVGFSLVSALDEVNLEVNSCDVREKGGESLLEAQLRGARSTCEDLKMRVESLTSEKTEADQRAAYLANTVDIQKEVVQGLESEVERLKQQCLEERATNTRHTEQEKAQLSTLVRELQTDISEHEQCIESLQTKRERSEREVESLSLQARQLVAEVEEKNLLLENVKGEMATRNSDNSDDLVREELQKSNAVISNLQESLERVNVEMEERLRRVNAEKDARIQRVISENKEFVSQLESSLETAKLEKQELKTGLEKSMREESVFREQVEQLEARITIDSETLRRVQQELNSVREELTESERQRGQEDSLLVERDTKIGELEAELVDMRERVSQMSSKLAAVEGRLGEREAMVAQGERGLREVGILLASREEEIAALQREVGERDGGSAGEGSVVEVITRERDKLLAELQSKQREIEKLESELSISRETLESLNCRIQEVTVCKSDLERLLEAARREASGERDVVLVRVGEVEGELERVRGELAAKQTECGRLSKQLEHLKAHLVQVEEQYTRDALRAEERERGERKRAEELQETLRHSSYMYLDQQDNLQTRVRVQDLEEQLHVLASQRDAAILELSSAREEAQDSASALHNLQTVLEQFQRDQSSELSEALKSSQLELANTLTELTTLKTHHTTIQDQLSEARAVEDQLRHQLQEREKRIEQARQEVTGLQATLQSTEEALEKLMREQGGRVDQNLVKNLVVGYVQAPDRKKSEVLNLISKILDFSPSEIQQVQTHRSGGGGGWLGGLWGRSNTSSPVATSPKLPVQGASLSQLFVSFLETESLPSLPQTTPTAMPLNPPPPGRIPEPDPDRPSRATASLSLIHPSVPVPQNHPITGSTSVVQQSVSSNTDTPGSGTAPGPTTTHSPPLTASASLPSLTNPHLSPITQSTTSQGTSSQLSQTITGAPILTPQRTRHLHNHQPSILRDLLSPLPPTS